MTEQDGFRVEAALQFGFEMTNDDGDEYACTKAQLIAFAKAAERKGRAEAIAKLEKVGSYSSEQEKGALGVVIDALQKRNAVTDAELLPILLAEEERLMTVAGYVRGTDEPGKRWVKLCSSCDTNIADNPSELCPGCQAYREHQS